MQRSGLENQECPSWFGRSMLEGGAVITRASRPPAVSSKSPPQPQGGGAVNSLAVNPALKIATARKTTQSKQKNYSSKTVTDGRQMPNCAID